MLKVVINKAVYYVLRALIGSVGDVGSFLLLGWLGLCKSQLVGTDFLKIADFNGGGSLEFLLHSVFHFDPFENANVERTA